MNVYIHKPVNYSDMQWPCDSWFHVPTKDEWDSIYNAGITDWAWTSTGGGNFSTYLKLPLAWNRNSWTGNVQNQNSEWYYWASTNDSSDSAYGMDFSSSNMWVWLSFRKPMWFPIRPFKDTPVTPDWTWTALYSDKIYHNSTLWLISVKNWNWWITIADKNLWATSTDITSSDSYGYYYQRWNNYWFPNSWSVTTSSTQVNAQNYWPNNYYSSSTFITRSSSPYWWDSSNNANLRWWVSW